MSDDLTYSLQRATEAANTNYETAERLLVEARRLQSELDVTRAALEAVLDAVGATRIYAENTGQGVGSTAPALGFADGEYASILEDRAGQLVSSDIVHLIEKAI